MSIEKQDKFKCKHIKCDMDGCYCSINKGEGYNHCVLPYYQENCEYFEDKNLKNDLEEKQIEEIAQCKNSYGITCSDCDGKKACGRYILAKALIDKENVVLSREDYEKLCHLAYFGYEDVRKETAERCIKDVCEMLRDCDTVYEDDGYHISPDVGYLKKDVDDGLNKIARGFGVEIKE